MYRYVGLSTETESTLYDMEPRKETHVYCLIGYLYISIERGEQSLAPTCFNFTIRTILT